MRDTTQGGAVPDNDQIVVLPPDLTREQAESIKTAFENAKLENIVNTPAARPTNVIAALARVMQELPGIAKDSDSSQGYKYRGIEQITAHAQTLLGKYGVVFVPKVVERKVVEMTINGKPWTQDELVLIYTIYGPGGVDDKIEVGPIYGLGRDNSDKGANKSMTQAFKYALLQVLCIGDSKDDADRDVAHERDAVQQKPPMSDAARAAADEWPDDDAFDQAHHGYRSAVGKLNSDQKRWLKDWKIEQKFGPWMTPDEYDATMSAIRDLRNGSRLGQDDDPESAEPPAKSPETPEQGEPAVETPEQGQPPVEETLTFEGEPIDTMNGRRCMEVLKSLELPVTGKVEELRDSLRQYVRAHSADTQLQQSGQAVDLCQFCGENPCICEETKQETPSVEPVNNQEVANESDSGRPF